MSKTPRTPPNAPLPPSEEPVPGRREVAAGERGSAPPEEVARYIAEFTAELSSLAREANLDLLAYLLDMARLEATQLMHTQASGS